MVFAFMMFLKGNEKEIVNYIEKCDIFYSVENEIYCIMRTENAGGFAKNECYIFICI